MINLHPRGRVTILEIDNPPVNATSQAVRQALLDAVIALDADPAVSAIVIAGAGRTFTAGGDITEFGKPPLLPHLPDVVSRIEACTKPVVIAWHGTALGGGCEIGLAGHARIIAPDGSVGLPEVKLGLLPGAGGTQRLPRLIDAVFALDLIASGRMVGAKEALALGLVDRIATGDLREEAVALAEGLIGQPLSRMSERPVITGNAIAWSGMVEKIRRGARGQIAPLKAIELIGIAINQPFAEGQPIERATFFELMAGPQSKALRHLFLAEREAARVPEVAGITPRKVQRVGIVGAGTMGSGIAVAFLDAGFDVTLMEASDTALQAGLDRVNGLYLRSVKSGRIDDDTRRARLDHLTPTSDLASLAGMDLVIEAIFEDMAVKRELLGRLGAILPAETLVATNTSYLDLEKMAEALPAPERFLGLHFFSPANIMKLLEIVRARQTSPEALATGLAIARRLKKIAVISGVCDGFIGNRMLARYRAQCEFMLEEGALPQEIDAALEAFGFAMGPVAVQDLAGLDIAWARRKRLAAFRAEKERYVPLADRLCEQGRFGQKAGKGWYLYEDGKRQVDSEIDAMIRAHAEATGRPQRVFAAEEIQRRVLTAMVNEGAKILGEGIAARPLDIDLVLVNGYGFPAWRGGPMHYADAAGLPAFLAMAEALAAHDGAAYAVAPLLAELANGGRLFADLNSP
jgi:3-hydroxyacyl-CoA dehydrogenase